MENSILNLCPFDPAYIIMGLVILVVLLLILAIITMTKLRRLDRNMIISCGEKMRKPWRI